MSAVRLGGRDPHRHGLRDGGPEPDQVRRGGRGQGRRAGRRLARVGRGGASETERELGVAVADIGAGTTDLALFTWRARRSIPRCCRSAATTSPTTWPSGSRPTCRWPRSSRSTTARATCRTVDPEERVDSLLRTWARRPAGQVSRLEVCRIIEARMRETFELLRDEMREAGRTGCCPPGSCSRAAAAQLAGVAELGRECSRCRSASPRRRGSAGSSGLSLRPCYWTAVGLLLWGAHRVSGRRECQRYESAPAWRRAGPTGTPSAASSPRSRRRRRSHGPGAARTAPEWRRVSPLDHGARVRGHPRVRRTPGRTRTTC